MDSGVEKQAHGLASTDIDAALERVLASKHFARAERLRRFLRYVVDRSIAGEADRLNGYSIGLDVFDRPDDFDPNLDTIVRVEARRLRQSLRAYYAEEGIDDPIVISLPTGGYSPAFNTRINPPDTNKSQAVLSARGPVIAVLPFDDYSLGDTDDFFAAGLTEQLIAMLTRFSDLMVISRTTSFQYRGVEVSKIRDELGADFVFEGSIRRSPTELRTTAQFIDALTDTHLWAATFDRQLTADSFFDVQDEIAEAIAARIADRYGPVGRANKPSDGSRTSSMGAFAALMKFYDYYASHSEHAHAEARTALNKAIEQDPKYADIWAALSAVHLDEYRFGFNQLSGLESPLDRAQACGLRAVALNPASAMAHQFLACTHFHAGDANAFSIAAEEALRLNPGHADLLADLGTCYGLFGDAEKGLALINKAISLNPIHPGWYHHYPALSLFVAGDLDGALAEATRGHMEGFFWSHALKTAIYAKLGRDDDAAAERETLLQIYPKFGASYAAEAAKWQAPMSFVTSLGEGLRAAEIDVG